MGIWAFILPFIIGAPFLYFILKFQKKIISNYPASDFKIDESNQLIIYNGKSVPFNTITQVYVNDNTEDVTAIDMLTCKNAGKSHFAEIVVELNNNGELRIPTISYDMLYKNLKILKKHVRIDENIEQFKQPFASPLQVIILLWFAGYLIYIFATKIN